MIRKVIGAALLAFAVPISAQTYITYDDGEIYTLSDTENVYVTEWRKVYTRWQGKDTTVYRELLPWTEIDVIPSATDGLEPGSEEWCMNYIPWSEGYTFRMQIWERSCDSDGDGEYTQCDVTPNDC